MSKKIEKVGFSDACTTRFTDKRTTIKLEEDGTIRYYDLETSLLCEGYYTQQIRGTLEYHEEGDYITFTFHNSDATHYRNFYTRRI